MYDFFYDFSILYVISNFFIKSSVCDYDNIALNIETVLIFLLVS